MEIPEIQYQPGQVSSQVSPVQIGDPTPAMRQNHAETQRQMAEVLSMMKQNDAVRLQNVKNNAFPVQELAQFSSTLSGLLQEQIDKNKEDDLAEGAMLAFEEGFQPTSQFEAQEKEYEKTGSMMTNRAAAYERETNDVEGAERIRNLSGWKKYGYAKAKMQQAGDGFGTWMEANASNPEYAVNVGGTEYTLANAPDAAIRQAVAAKMAQNYISPYGGMNRSFLAKYMYPSMQRGMSSTVNKYAAANAERIRANRIDEAKTSFLDSPDKFSAMQNLRQELISMGYTEADVRGEMVEMAGQFRSRSELDAFLDSPYGPNGKSFREQYPGDAQEAIKSFNDLKTGQATNNENERKINDLNAKEQAMQAVMKDRSDGSFDADPKKLKEYAEQARANGYNKTAEFWESQIEETAYMKNSTAVKEQYEAQILAGIIPSQEEILQNPALSQADKQALLSKAGSSGGASPDSDVAKGHKKIIESSIRKRGKWTRDGANDPGVAAMELQAWQEYTEVYNRELQANGGNEAAAASAALSDFKSKFGTDEKTGQYALVQPDGKVSPDRVGKYAGYDPEGTASSTVNPMQQFNDKLKYTDANTAINTMPDLYEGEEKQLRSLSDSFATTGSVGTIPTLYYQLQQRYGGNVSIMDILNKRLEANGLDKLPTELNKIIKPVEDSFDEDSYKFISYKPNATRTDIGMISSGAEPIYAQSSAAQEEIKSIFGMRESPQAGYDAINRGTGGDSPGGGTRYFGRALTDMTLGEIKQLQSSGQLFAAGRYQFIPDTLVEAAKAAGITDDMPFNEAVQDRIFFVHLDRYGAHGPWEQWWIQQGGEHLRLTPAEKQKIDAFRESYDPSQPWRQAKNTRAELLHVYTSGNIGPTSTGAHLDVKQVGGGRFEETALDDYVVVDDPEFGQISLGEIRKRTGGIGDNFDEHVARGSHGIDYGLYSGTKISLKGGAKVVRTAPSIHGDVLTIQVPDGRQFTFIHGTSAKR